MTKKHFIALADVIREHNGTTDDSMFEGAHLETLARFCEGQNPRFNTRRWLDYINGRCGPSGGRRKPPATKELFPDQDMDIYERRNPYAVWPNEGR